MLNINEIYLLNSVLDNNEIYGLDKEKTLNFKEKQDDELKSLKEKKIINEDNSFNDISYLIVKNLEKYKAAKSYLWINESVFSIDDTENLLMFKKNEEEYDFKKLPKIYLLISLIKENEILNINKEIKDSNKIKINAEDFVQDYAVKSKTKNALIIRKESGNYIKIPTYYKVFFEKDSSYYCYDVLNEELEKYNPYDAKLEIINLLYPNRR